MTSATPAFVCRELRLRQFRNFSELELAFPSAGVAIIGPNGSGKTNLLEAIYYLETFRSFRGAADEQLVRFGADAFHVRGRFEDPATGTVREIAAGYERSGRRKRVTVDGVEAERLADAVAQVGAVVFSPSDLALVAGPPSERRRFLDIVLSLNCGGYLDALQRYRGVLKQRNALLRERAPAASVDAWTEGLIESGARLMAARAAWVAERAATFRERCAAIGDAPMALEYRPSVDAPAPASRAALADALRRELERLRPRERERGATLAGPHRDDLRFVREGAQRLDLREYGSGGQQRTAAIALRMVEAETVRAARGRAPLVLLDDIFAELDPERSRRALGLLEGEEPGQVLVTAPKPADVDARAAALPRWRISEGRIET